MGKGSDGMSTTPWYKRAGYVYLLDEVFLLQERKPLRHVGCLRLPEILHCGRHDSKQSVDGILQKIASNGQTLCTKTSFAQIDLRR